MAYQLASKSIFFSYQTVLLLVLFFALRIISFYLAPYEIAQAILVFALVMLLGILFFKNHEYAWMLVLGELLLGGAGHTISFYGLSLRTCFIAFFTLLWVGHALVSKSHHHRLYIPQPTLFAGVLIIFVVSILSALNGLLQGNGLLAVIQDLIPFMYFIILLPTYHLLQEELKQHYFIRLIIVFVIGSALFALITYILFVTGIHELQDPFYQWFRDVQMGKITEVTPYFYRIVLPEHLIIVPGVLMILSLLSRDERHHIMWRILLVLGMLILALNFSRAYVLGLVIGMLILAYKHQFKKWGKEIIFGLLSFFILFMAVNGISSLGQSFGWEILGIRIGSFVEPTIEESTTTRLQLLAPIFATIREHPVIGSGLGASIPLLDPVTYINGSTRQFDWGYFEMIAELGGIGALLYLAVIAYVLWLLWQKIKAVSDYHDFKIGLLAGLVSLLVINITTPALLHVLGITYLALVIAFVAKPIELHEWITTLLYRIFNRLKG